MQGWGVDEWTDEFVWQHGDDIIDEYDGEEAIDMFMERAIESFDSMLRSALRDKLREILEAREEPEEENQDDE